MMRKEKEAAKEKREKEATEEERERETPKKNPKVPFDFDTSNSIRFVLFSFQHNEFIPIHTRPHKWT